MGNIQMKQNNSTASDILHGHTNTQRWPFMQLLNTTSKKYFKNIVT